MVADCWWRLSISAGRGRTVATAFIAILPMTASAMTVQEAQEAIRVGTTLAFRMAYDVGELRKDSRYIVRYDRAAGEIIVSDLMSRRIARTPAAADTLQTGLTLWGTRFLWDRSESGVCLRKVNTIEAKCSAIVVGPLLRDKFSLDRDIIDIAAERLITQLQMHLANPQAVIDRGRSCPRKPALNQTHLADRFLADALYFNGQALPYITDAAQRALAETSVDAAVDRLIDTARPSARTTYTDCYGGLDLITPFQVARALDAMNRLRPNPRIGAYLRQMWKAVSEEGAIEVFGARNAETRTKYANAFAAYLHMATILEWQGIRALQPYTHRGLELLIAEQTRNSPQACVDSTGSFTLAYGGWPHSDTECSQNVGYHDFIVGGLIAAHEYYTRTGACRAVEADLCRRIERSLDDALVWIDGLKEGPGKAGLVDRAQGSTAIKSAPGSGDVTGSATGFRIIAYRGEKNASARATLLLALEEAIRSRPNQLPVSAYLRSLAFSPEEGR